MVWVYLFAKICGVVFVLLLICPFSFVQQPKSGLGSLIVEVYKSHTDTLTREAATYTIQNKLNRRTSMPSSGFETPSLSNQAAADLRLRPHGQRDRPFTYLRTKYCKYLALLLIRLYVFLIT